MYLTKKIKQNKKATVKKWETWVRSGKKSDEMKYCCTGNW